MANKKMQIESKLLNLREWLTVEEAAQQLTNILGEDISAPATLRLALDGNLKLSVNFVNPVDVRCGKIVSKEDAASGELEEVKKRSSDNTKLFNAAKGKAVKDMKSLDIYGNEFISLDDKVTTIKGVWDLPMVGNERLDIENEYQKLMGSTKVKFRDMESVFVERQDGQICQIQYCHEENDFFEYERKLAGNVPLDYSPASSLPPDYDLVVRKQALIELRERLSSEKFSREGPLGPTERRSLLKMILAMAIDGYGYDPDESKSPIPQQIVTAAANNDHSINVDTVRKWLKVSVSLPKDPE